MKLSKGSKKREKLGFEFDKTKLENCGEEGLKALAIILACFKSSETKTLGTVEN